MLLTAPDSVKIFIMFLLLQRGLGHIVKLGLLLESITYADDSVEQSPDKLPGRRGLSHDDSVKRLLVAFRTSNTK